MNTGVPNPQVLLQRVVLGLEMQVLSKVSLAVFIHTAALVMLGTIFLCYGLAVGLGHVPAWLPMISDCAVLSPEKYPFRLGFVVGAALIATQVVMTYNADRPYSKSKTSLILGLVASLGLAIVGVVNEQECNPVHSGRLRLLISLNFGTVIKRSSPPPPPQALLWCSLCVTRQIW